MVLQLVTFAFLKNTPSKKPIRLIVGTLLKTASPNPLDLYDVLRALKHGEILLFSA
jgi:hypothetical protein